jgi:carboxyl-terminal processing protease
MKLFIQPILIAAVMLALGAANITPAQRKKQSTVVRGQIASVTSEPAMSPEAMRRYLTFIEVWTNIRDNYFDSKFNNLDWEAVQKEYDPKVKAVTTDEQLYPILNSMISRLGVSHLAIIPPEVYQAIEQTRIRVKERESATPPKSPVGDSLETEIKAPLNLENPYVRYGIGVDLGLINDRFVITHIERNSAAEHAGLHTGFVLESINGVSLAEMLQRIQMHYSSFGKGNLSRFVPAVIVSFMLNGTKDTKVVVGYLDQDDAKRELSIQRERLAGRAVTIAPNFPEQQLNFEARPLDEQTGYIRFNLFAIPVVEKFCAAMTEFSGKKSIIIDLRGNTGGLMASLIPLAGMLTGSTIDLGTASSRFGTENLRAASKAKNFKGRVVVIVDATTASAGEMFASALRENNRALIVGQKTSGEALPSVAVSLPTGAIMQYPIADYRSAQGNVIEGRGVAPDREISLGRTSLLAGKDDQLNEALRLAADSNGFDALTVVPNNKTEPLNVVPPPPPAAKPAPVGSASGADRRSSRKATDYAATGERAFAPGHDKNSLSFINDFLDSIGGKSTVRAISSYTLRGTVDVWRLGSWSKFSFLANRQAPNRYSEISRSESVGEIREIFDGKSRIFQNDLGTDVEVPFSESARVDPLWPILALTDLDYFTSLSYTGTFDREGRNTAVVEGKTRDGVEIAFAFDIQTKMLVNYTARSVSTSFADYRKVGNLSLPYEIRREGGMGIRLEEVNLNAPIDSSVFSKKERCFDRLD